MRGQIGDRVLRWLLTRDLNRLRRHVHGRQHYATRLARDGNGCRRATSENIVQRVRVVRGRRCGVHRIQYLREHLRGTVCTYAGSRHRHGHGRDRHDGGQLLRGHGTLRHGLTELRQPFCQRQRRQVVAARSSTCHECRDWCADPGPSSVALV